MPFLLKGAHRIAVIPKGRYKEMTAYKLILFDLDGTLTDSREDITRSIQYAQPGERAVCQIT